MDALAAGRMPVEAETTASGVEGQAIPGQEREQPVVESTDEYGISAVEWDSINAVVARLWGEGKTFCDMLQHSGCADGWEFASGLGSSSLRRILLDDADLESQITAALYAIGVLSEQCQQELGAAFQAQSTARQYKPRVSHSATRPKAAAETESASGHEAVGAPPVLQKV